MHLKCLGFTLMDSLNSIVNESICLSAVIAIISQMIPILKMDFMVEVGRRIKMNPLQGVLGHNFLVSKFALVFGLVAVESPQIDRCFWYAGLYTATFQTYFFSTKLSGGSARHALVTGVL